MTDAVEVLRIDSLEDERLDAYVRLTERELRCVLEPQKGKSRRRAFLSLRVPRSSSARCVPDISR